MRQGSRYLSLLHLHLLHPLRFFIGSQIMKKHEAQSECTCCVRFIFDSKLYFYSYSQEYFTFLYGHIAVCHYCVENIRYT